MKKQYITTEQRARRALACCGKAPAVLATMAIEHQQRIAELCDVAGVVCQGAAEKLRLVLIDHYESQKATSEELDDWQSPLNSESET